MSDHSDQPNTYTITSPDAVTTTDLVEAPGINRANLRALISRIKRDSGERMSFLDAALLVEMMIGNELRECAAEMAKE